MFPGAPRRRENCRVYTVVNSGTRIALMGDDPDFIILELINLVASLATVTLPNTAPIGKTFTFILTANPQTLPAVITHGVYILVPAKRAGTTFTWTVNAGQEARFIYTPNGWLTPRGLLASSNEGSSTGGGVAFGSGACANAAAVAVGNAAVAGSSCTALGYGAYAAGQSVAAGQSANGGANGVAIGYSCNTNNKDKAVALGHTTKAERFRELVKSADGVVTCLQSFSILDWYRDTTDATPIEILLGGTAAQYAVLLNSSAFMFKLLAAARDNVNNDCAMWELTGGIKRGANAAATAIVGSVTKTVTAADAGAASWDINATADTTNGSLKLEATGEASKTIRWNVRGDISELRF